MTSNEPNMKRSICRGCFVNFLRSEGYNKHYCSAKCRSMIQKTRKCKPFCDVNNQVDVEVEFKNKTFHTKRICKLCRHGDYVPRGSSLKKITNEFLELEKHSSEKYGDSFYTSKEWLSLRYQILIKYGHECRVCGSSKKPMHVDHIKPRSKFPKLELDPNNLQVLCKLCNFGKSDKF